MLKRRASLVGAFTLGFVSLLGSACHGANAGAGGHASTGHASTTGTSSSSGAGGAGGAPAAAFTVDDISKMAGNAPQAEPTLAVGKNGIVAAAWNGGAGQPEVGYAFSTDGGMTWLAPGIASPSDALGYGDPTMVAADDGTIYLSMTGFDQGFTHGRVVVVKAAPGATSFGAPVVVTDPAMSGPYDKPVIAITKSQTLVVSYTDLGPSNDIGVARSTDGVHFTRTTAGKSSNGALSMPCAAEDGSRLWVVFLQPGSVQLRWSDDDGATFPLANASRPSPSSELDISAEDPVCVGKGNDVWVLYGRSHDMVNPANFNTTDYALRLAHSGNGGAQFEAPHDVQDASAGALSMEPAFALETNGTLDLAYYAGNQVDDAAGSFRLARSTDAGQTFAPSTVIASPFVFTVSRSSAKWPGDYSTIVAENGRLYAAYSHNVQASAHISFASLPLQ